MTIRWAYESKRSGHTPISAKYSAGNGNPSLFLGENTPLRQLYWRAEGVVACKSA